MLIPRQYRLDDAEEACDSARPVTAACPLLPGQMVNVLDVPVEIVEAPQRVCSASADLPTTIEMPMTTNPEDRYKKVHRKPPTKLPRYYCSSDALRERFNMDGSRLAQDISRTNNVRPSSPVARSAKRMRFEEPSFQRPGACQTDATLEDIATLASIPDLDQQMEQVPVLRPFAPCPSPSADERPVTRGGFLTDFTKSFSFPFFGSKRRSAISSHLSSEDERMDSDTILDQLPQYDGAFDEPRLIDTEWPLSPPMSDFADDESWPLPPPQSFQAPQAQVSSPIHGPSTPTAAIPLLNLNNQPQVNALLPHALPSPALSSSTRSDVHHANHQRNSDIQSNGSFDMASPTFTAETLSSSPGIPTPDRIRSSVHIQSIKPNDNVEITELNFSTGLEDLSRRLSALTSSESEYEDDETDNESLFQFRESKFYGFPVPPKPLYLQEDQGSHANTNSNSSCLTLKPTSRQLASSTAENTDTAMPLSVPSTANEFSSDVFDALGIAM